MPLPTFDLQTRTSQKRTLERSASWANYIWLVGIEVPARTFYPKARVGDRLHAVALYPYPYIPYFPVCCADPFADVWLSMFLEHQRGLTNQQSQPVLCYRHVLDSIGDEYITYRWPHQLGVISQDTVCRECGMVDVVDGFELAFGVDPCNPALCLLNKTLTGF